LVSGSGAVGSEKEIGLEGDWFEAVNSAKEKGVVAIDSIRLPGFSFPPSPLCISLAKSRSTIRLGLES
jgi:hypothetical protein